MVSEETKTKVIEKINELESEVNILNRELLKESELNYELIERLERAHKKSERYREIYLFEKKLNSNIRKVVISGAILFGATFFALGYLFGTKPQNYQQQTPQIVEVKKEPEQQNKTEIEQILDKAFEKYKND